MKKSPGKWIKTVLFGKKNSKSTLSKNATPDKKSAVKATVVNLAEDSEPSQFTDRGSENIELEKSLSGSSGANALDSQSNIFSVPLTDDEMQRQEQAATKVQAAFRGYLARRAFRALNGIIRLQALIRGHLVRRQAVATLHCMQAILKLQALARGQKIGANLFYGAATKLFPRKLLVSLPTTMPLSLQYDPAEPNSAWNWLERWSLSHFWENPTKTKKVLNPKSQRKQGIAQITEHDSGKSKRTVRKVSTSMNSDNGALSSLEIDKPKRNPRKIISHQTDSVQDNPQNELERVKRNLKKVSVSSATSSEKPEKSPLPISVAPDISEDIVIYSHNPVDSNVIVDKSALPESTSEILTDELVNLPDNDPPVVETNCSENGERTESTLNLPEELSFKEEECVKENQKIRKRRSLPAKQEYTENISQNTSNLPSYMAATKSAKAKLRAQGFSQINEDGNDYGYVRRHSLPASTNGKLSSSSPRIQKLMLANGKGGIKTNKSLTTSRDDKALQPGWRR